MKKGLIVVLLFLTAAGFAAAEINLGAFPLGTWVDENYAAHWEFTSGNIRILAADGEVYYDFDDKTLEDFRIGASGGATLSFSCMETGKRYKFTKPLTSSGMTLEIERPNREDYRVEMSKK
jgi:hypothetical protein